MAGIVDDADKLHIILPSVEGVQERMSGDLFSLVLMGHKYEVSKSEIVNGKALILAKNPAGAYVTFLLDPISREIQMMYTMALLYRISVRDHDLAQRILDLSLQTRRVSILLDRDMREIVLITAIDLLGSPSFDEIIESVESRWREIEEIRNSNIVDFVDIAAPVSRNCEAI